MLASATTEAGDLVVLAIHEGGLRKPFGKEKLAIPRRLQGHDDPRPAVQGARRRPHRPGANADPLPLPDVYQALQTGTVDGVEANLPLIYLSKWYEVAKYITGNVNLWPFPTVLAINKAKYDSLTGDQQAALTSSAAGITDFSIKIFTTPGSTVAQDLVNCGAVYVNSTDAEKADLAKAGATAVSQLAPESQDLRQADPGAQGRDPAAAARRRPCPPPRPGRACRHRPLAEHRIARTDAGRDP